MPNSNRNVRGGDIPPKPSKRNKRSQVTEEKKAELREQREARTLARKKFNENGKKVWFLAHNLSKQDREALKTYLHPDDMPNPQEINHHLDQNVQRVKMAIAIYDKWAAINEPDPVMFYKHSKPRKSSRPQRKNRLEIERAVLTLKVQEAELEHELLTDIPFLKRMRRDMGFVRNTDDYRDSADMNGNEDNDEDEEFGGVTELSILDIFLWIEKHMSKYQKFIRKSSPFRQ